MARSAYKRIAQGVKYATEQNLHSTQVICIRHTQSVTISPGAELQAHIQNLLMFVAQLLVALDDISQQILMRLHFHLHHKADDTSMNIQHTVL